MYSWSAELLLHYWWFFASGRYIVCRSLVTFVLWVCVVLYFVRLGLDTPVVCLFIHQWSLLVFISSERQPQRPPS